MSTLEDFENAPIGSVARIPGTSATMVKGDPDLPYPWTDFTSTFYNDLEVYYMGYRLDESNPSNSRDEEIPVERLARLGVTALTTKDPDGINSYGYPNWSGNCGWAEHMLPIAQAIWDEGFNSGVEDSFDFIESENHECTRNPYRKGEEE